nr:immunoglobulin heavy chain junction region [Macaca mulatta]
CTGRHAGFDYW